MTAVIPAPRGPEPDSWQLVARAQAGDPDALAGLYRRYNPELRQFLVMRWCRGRPDLVDDLAADTWVRFITNLDYLQDLGRSPLAWLMTVARNLAVDHFKSARVTRNMLVAELDTDEFDQHRRDHPGADVEADLAALRAAVRRAVAGLDNEHQRRCLELRFIAGLSVAETAARLGVTDGACKALQYRAVRSLRRAAPELLELR